MMGQKLDGALDQLSRGGHLPPDLLCILRKKGLVAVHGHRHRARPNVTPAGRARLDAARGE